MLMYECETANGRVFRVLVTNKRQQKRFLKVIEDNKSKNYEKFIRVDLVLHNIHNITQFEKLNSELQ